MSTVPSSAVELRHALHAHPELSGAEAQTARRILEFFEPLLPDEVVTGLGGHGVAVVFGHAATGPTILLRSELDALPIAEINDMPYRSVHAATSHKCGHDGHMAILAEVGCALAARRPAHGRVVLLFQPAEETGAGAAAVVADPRFERIRPDRVFGLHNVPGYPCGRIVIRDGTFTCASRGMRLCLQGRSAHAAQPETGASPAAAMARLVTMFGELPTDLAGDGELMFATVVGATTGGRNFGVVPDRAEICVTLRSETDATMHRLVAWCEEQARRCAAEDGLGLDITYEDVFAATVNAPAAVATLRRACRGMPQTEADEPFRWSEDFGRYTQVAEGAFFALGAGEDLPALHNDDYDFPDALIATGADIFVRIVDACLEEGVP